MSDYCEMPLFFSERWPVARKEHKCCECGQPIFAGEKYGSFSGKWSHAFDGGMQVFKQHLECEEACRFIRDYLNSDECIGFGELFETWADFLTLNTPDFTLSEKAKQYRSIMAKVIWRKHRGKPLTFFKPREVINPSLIADRNRKW